MAFESLYAPVREAGNGSKVDFTFDFKIFNTSDIVAGKVNATTNVETPGVLGVDYTVTINTVTDGGTLTWAVAPATGVDSFIRRSMALTQTADIPSNNIFREVQIENALDKAIMICAELQEQIDRAILIPETSVSESPTAEEIIDLVTDAQTAAEAAQAAAEASASSASSSASSASGSAVAAAASAAAINFTKDNDGTMAANSDSVVPSQKAVRTYVAAEAVKFYAGTISRDMTAGSGSVSYPDCGFTPKAIIFYGIISTNPYSSSFGLVTVANTRTVYFHDGAPTVAGNWAGSDDVGYAILIEQSTPNVYQRAGVSAWLSNGFSLDWVVSGVPIAGTGVVKYLAIG